METNIFGLVKIIFRVARVHKKMARVGSGWPKWPRVGSNLWSVLTRPEPFFYEPEQPEEIFLPTQKYFFP